MAERCWRLLGLDGLVQRALSANRLGTARDLAGEEDAPRGFDLDVVDHLGNPLAVLLGRKVTPAWKRLELERVLGEERSRIDVLVAPVGLVLRATVVPDALQRLAVDQRVDAVEPRPPTWTGD